MTVANWAAYLRDLRDVRAQPEATAELSLRTALVTLLREIAGPGITLFPEAGTDVGQPDLIAKVGPLVIGYGETKAPGTIRALEGVLDTRQLIAYRQLPNLILTDYLHFILLRDGVEVARATLISSADLDAGRTARADRAGVEDLLEQVVIEAHRTSVTAHEPVLALDSGQALQNVDARHTPDA